LKSIHFNEIPSTQTYIKENWEQLKTQFCAFPLIVSCNTQNQGIGRSQNVWDDLGAGIESERKSLAFSFTLPPHPHNATLTTLELVILVADFFENTLKSPSIKLKWPNDMMTQDRRKFAGIIAGNLESNLLLAGIGINLYSPAPTHSSYKTAHDFLFSSSDLSLSSFHDDYKQALPIQIYKYILQNRNKLTNKDDLISQWEQRCYHKGEKVRIVNEVQSVEGIFKGIGPLGQALIETDINQNQIQEMFTGSLFCFPQQS
jgi:biotin-[acetyl-CoA-carboxylase] ligase BirA-like protein